jgi:hypothetical protein
MALQMIPDDVPQETLVRCSTCGAVLSFGDFGGHFFHLHGGNFWDAFPNGVAFEFLQIETPPPKDYGNSCNIL